MKHDKFINMKKQLLQALHYYTKRKFIRASYLDKMSDRIWSWRYNVENIWSSAIKFRELYHGFEIRNPRNAEERW